MNAPAFLALSQSVSSRCCTQSLQGFFQRELLSFFKARFKEIPIVFQTFFDKGKSIYGKYTINLLLGSTQL